MIELNAANPRVLYIMGTGRSGTTILEVVLTNSRDVAGVGEVTHIFRDGILHDEACSCQRSVQECSVWSGVLRSLGWADLGRASEVDTLFRHIERHNRFPLTWLGVQSRTALERYRGENSALFALAAKVAGVRTIVDSSKFAGRALALHRAMPDQVSIIWLVRSPEGVLTAFNKPNKDEQKPKRPVAAMLYYLYVMTCAWLVKRRLGDKVLVVSYEQFLETPGDALSRIEQWSGIELSDSKRKIANGEVLDVYHIVTGNRLRKEPDLRFRSGASHHELTGGEMRIAALVMNVWNRLLSMPKLIEEKPRRS